MKHEDWKPIPGHEPRNTTIECTYCGHHMEWHALTSEQGVYRQQLRCNVCGATGPLRTFDPNLFGG